MSTTTTARAPEASPATATPFFNDFSRHPPPENFLTLDGLLKSHAAEPDQTPLVCYPYQSVSDFEEHTAKDIDRYTNLAVHFYIRNGLEPADPSADKAPVVALLSPSTFEVVVSFFALNRLGYAVLFLSTRLTAPAYARLMGMAHCDAIIAAESLATVGENICGERPSSTSLPMLRRRDYRGHVAGPPFERPGVDIAKESKKMAWILHSSGSTGFPKPIFLSNMQCLANFRKSFGMRAFCTSPLFHSHALNELGRAIYTKAPMYLWNYNFPITSNNAIEAMNVAKPKLFGSVPYVLKLLAEKREGIEALVRPDIVIFGGSSCPDDLGDRLVAAGVNLVGNYGATETGQIMTSFRPPGDTEWQYMRLHRPVADHTLMDEIAPGVFEAVGLDGLPSQSTTNSKPPYSAKNPQGSFRTADLFTRHSDPAKSNYWKYLSRLDDRITLVNGEKVLPIPIEGRIRQEDLVQEAVVFGYQRTVPGVLIFRSAEHGTTLSYDEYLEHVWPAVEAANISAESFSRIPKDLIVIKGADVTYPRTDKGTCIRAQVYEQFAEDINQAYQSFETGSEQGGGLQLDIAGIEDWLLSKFRDDLSVPLPDTSTDIFSAGVDSLQTTRIWRMIKKDLDLGEGGKSMSQNVVFEKGTVKALAAYLCALRTGEDVGEEEDEIAMMRELIDRYSAFTEHRGSLDRMPAKETVVLTGATGNLGAFIAAQLAQSPAVEAIYTLVRAPDTATATSRLVSSLTTRGIYLSDAEQAKLHALPSDLSDPDLGLPQATLTNLLNTATTVIHSAWAVNFNLPVHSFESQHIRGTHNLLNFCLRSRLPSPAKLFFCSSVSAASGTPKPATIPESTVEELEHAQKGMGYGKSKLVTEHIVRNAMRSTGMHARVLRIGQLSGDSKSGIWNETEAVALMIRSALSTGCLPALEESPSWLPVDVCAQAVCEIALDGKRDGSRPGESDADLVYHILNPRNFNFRTALLPYLHSCPTMPAFETVSPAEWLARLDASEPDPAKNPSIKLVEYWRSKYSGVHPPQATDGDEVAGLTFETARTVQACPLLGEVRDPVSEGLVGRYVDMWMRGWQRG